MEKLVNQVPGVESSMAEWANNRLTVVVAPGASVDDDAIRDAVKRANFTPAEDNP